MGCAHDAHGATALSLHHPQASTCAGTPQVLCAELNALGILKYIEI
jgi:hypothetical protein